MAKVKLTETVLRDSHQSLIATRMSTEEMLPILDKLDKIGYNALECWGGATFDSCLRFLNEDPWERLRKIKSVAKNSIKNGINVVRIFDALNDPRNLKVAIDATKKEGGHVQAAFSYTTSPVHSNEYFSKYAKQLEEMGADSICIKDMSGLLKPYDAYDLVKSLKANTSLPIELHTHYTSGLASMTALKAIEAGCDIIDTAISPMAMGTSQPPTEALVATLAGTEYDTGLDLAALDEICKYFTPLRDKYIKSGLLDPAVLKVDVNALMFQVPGGMLSNLVSQLKQAGKSDKLREVLEEVPRVRADAGYPPLVTPSSQIVGTQAVFNVINGERYKMVTKEFKALVKGEYGKTPVPISKEFIKKIAGDEKLTTGRPADALKPELARLREEIKEYIEQEEDVLSYALFEQVALKFFEKRRAEKYKLDGENGDIEKQVHPV